jgi:amidase
LSPKHAEKPTPESLVFASATTVARIISRGDVTSLELTKTILRRIETYNPMLNAIITLLGKEALVAARKADEAVKRGEKLGLLHGVPVTVKDCLEIKGVRTTAGLKSLADYIPLCDSAPVERLRAAGAVILGHTNISEHAADWQSYNDLFGTTNNPWDKKLTPGGSTGGGAAALASGLTFLEVGSDIGGSIRVPAHFCGIYGLKPSLGVVSARGHVPPLPGSPVGEPVFNVAGPVARSADDLRLAMKVLGGADGEASKAFTWKLPAPRRSKLNKYRLGFVLDDPACRVSSEVKAPLSKMIEALKEEGVEAVEGWPTGIDPKRLFDDYRYIRYSSSAGFLRIEEISERLKAEKISDGSDAYVAAHAYASSVKEFQDALWRRVQTQEAWRVYFRGVDAFLIPPAFVPAFPHNHTTPMRSRILQTPDGLRRYEELRFWISFATLCGLPAAVAPIGSTPSGLPVGVQIIGPYLEDSTVIDIADKITQVVGGFKTPPDYA